MWHCIWRLAKCIYALFIWFGYWRLCMCLFIQAIACGFNLTFIYGAVGLWVSYWTDIILWDIWDGILFMCSLHSIKKGFIKNIGYTVFIEKNLIVAGFYRWIGYSNIKCKLFHMFSFNQTTVVDMHMIWLSELYSLIHNTACCFGAWLFLDLWQDNVIMQGLRKVLCDILFGWLQ